MIKNIKIRELVEIAEKNNFNYIEICRELGIGTATWYRWIRGISEPKNKSIIEKINKVIDKYK